MRSAQDLFTRIEEGSSVSTFHVTNRGGARCIIKKNIKKEEKNDTAMDKLEKKKCNDL